MARAGCTKIKDLKDHEEWKSEVEMSNLTGIRSIRFMKHVMDVIISALPSAYLQRPREENLNEEEEENNELFPDLIVAALVEEEPQEETILRLQRKVYI